MSLPQAVVMVDIDAAVVALAREHLRDWGAEATFADPRLDVHFADARVWLEAREEETFDVIIADVTDPGGVRGADNHLARLYDAEWFALLAARLRPGGIVVSQAGPAGRRRWQSFFRRTARAMQSSFSAVVPASVEMPSFGSQWGFLLASNDSTLDKYFFSDGSDTRSDHGGHGRGRSSRDAHDGVSVSQCLARLLSIDCDVVDAIIRDRLLGGAAGIAHASKHPTRELGELGSFDGFNHHELFAFPKALRAWLLVR